MKVNRRDTLKTLMIGGLVVGTLPGCKTKDQQTGEPTKVKNSMLYGRTKEEKARDKALLNAHSYFTKKEASTLAILVDLICPLDEVSRSATEAGVLAFIDFIVKDMTQHQLPLRSGLAWLQRESFDRYEKEFTALSDQQIGSILEDIAYPEKTNPHHLVGEKFFTLLRNLTLTGFYTSEIGIKDIGYQGNRPNFWNGVPDEVMKKHGFTLEEKYATQYITAEQRTSKAKWDEEGNLL